MFRLSANGRLTSGSSGFMDWTVTAHFSMASTTAAWLLLIAFMISF
jgi:hypothetical protein